MNWTRRGFSTLAIALSTIALWTDPSAVRADGAAAGLAGLYEEGRCDEIRSRLLPRRADGSAEEAYYLGRCDSAEEKYDSATELLRRAIELDPDRSIYHQALGEAIGNHAGTVGFLKAMGMAGDIRGSFETAVELDPDNVDARRGLMRYFLEAPGIAGGSKTKALEQATEIAKRDPVMGHLAHGDVYDKQGEDAKEEAAYRAALETDPENGEAHLSLGVHLTEMERYDEAFALYESRLERAPDDMAVAYQLGRTASISGEKLEAGAAALETYCRHRPRNGQPSVAWAHYRLGLIREQQGAKDRARTEYQTALELDPKHDRAKKALRKLS